MWQKRSTVYLIILIICCILAFGFVVLQNIIKRDLSQNKITEQIKNSVSESIAQMKWDYQENFDTESDYSFQKYVSDKNVLQNKKYEPSDLSEITWEYLVIKAAKPYLRQSAQYALTELSQAFYKKFKSKLYILSSYRSYNDQVRLFEQWCTTNRCARIWASEHQLWLAVDMHIATGKWYKQFSSWHLEWLNENAYKYGFINTYSKWPKIDGKMKEIWHWRYVGVPFATELHEKHMSFAERINRN